MTVRWDHPKVVEYMREVAKDIAKDLAKEGMYGMYELQRVSNSIEQIGKITNIPIDSNTLSTLVKLYKKGYSLENRNRGKGL